MKHQEKYIHLFKVVILLTKNLHRHCQDFTLEIISKHQNDPTKHGEDGDY